MKMTHCILFAFFETLARTNCRLALALLVLYGCAVGPELPAT